MGMAEAESAMAAVRAEIDAIDDEIHAAVQRRARLVERVRQIKAAQASATAAQASATEPGKAAPTRTPLRPAREAQILRRLAARADTSAQPFGVTAAIWREIISGAVLMQGGLTVSVFAPGEGPERDRVWRAARTHFGALTPLVARASAGRMIQDIQGPEPAVGVAPGQLEPNAGGEIWWRACVDPSPLAPRIVAALPFAPEPGGGVDAWLAAVSPLEPSGDDVTLFGMRLAQPMSRAAIAARLGRLAAATGVEARLAALTPDALLLACDGAHLEPQSLLRSAMAFAFEVDPQDLVVAGLYARPLGGG